MGNLRFWLFRGLTIVAIGLMLISWFLPWWYARFDMLPGIDDAVTIHPYGLSHRLESTMAYAGEGTEMPTWFTPFMWAYISLCILLLLYSLFLKYRTFNLLGKFKFSLPGTIIGIVGFSFILVAVLAVIVAAIRTGQLGGMKLLGYSFVQLGWVMDTGAYGTLQLGYYLAYVAGLLCILLALFRNKIIGQSELNTK